MQEVLKPLFLEPGQLAVLELDTKRLLRGIILDNSSGHSLRTNLAAGNRSFKYCRHLVTATPLALAPLYAVPGNPIVVIVEAFFVLIFGQHLYSCSNGRTSFRGLWR